MTSKPTICVLEDADVRIDWIRKVLPDYEIVWATTVPDFFTKLNDIPPEDLKLIVLDHDLDVSAFGRGYCETPMVGTGMDVVYTLETTVPVLVWSCNNTAAPVMRDRLADKGIYARWVPFTVTNAVAAALGFMLRK